MACANQWPGFQNPGSLNVNSVLLALTTWVLCFGMLLPFSYVYLPWIAVLSLQLPYPGTSSLPHTQPLPVHHGGMHLPQSDHSLRKGVTIWWPNISTCTGSGKEWPRWHVALVVFEDQIKTALWMLERGVIIASDLLGLRWPSELVSKAPVPLTA